jgi:hypothetical protein
LEPVLIGKDIQKLTEAKEDPNGNLFAVLVFIRKNMGAGNRGKGLQDACQIVCDGIPSRLRCIAFSRTTQEAKFPGFTLAISPDPLECFVDGPNAARIAIAYFDDEQGTTMHATSNIDVTDDNIIIRDNSARVFEISYTPETRWSRGHPLGSFEITW